MIEHIIVTTTSDSVKARNNPTPLHVGETINEEVNKMLKLGVIQPSYSSYSAPVVIVNKKPRSDKSCICNDFLRINQGTVTDAEPMLGAEVIFSRFRVRSA